jgi:hypothetical protein
VASDGSTAESVGCCQQPRAPAVDPPGASALARNTAALRSARLRPVSQQAGGKHRPLERDRNRDTRMALTLRFNSNAIHSYYKYAIVRSRGPCRRALKPPSGRSR